MRKSTTALLVVMCLCSWVSSFGQNDGRWKVVQQVVLTRQTNPVLPTTLFTPTKAAVYRLSVYMSAYSLERQSTTYDLLINWNDVTGVRADTALSVNLNGGSSWTQLGGYLFSPQPGTPFFYSVSINNSAPIDAVYNVVFTIEQLQ